MTPNQTQRIYPDDPLPSRCMEHVRRLDKLEGRVDSGEKRIDGIEDLRMLVQLLADRIRLILWLTAIATSAIIVGVVGRAFEAVTR